MQKDIVVSAAPERFAGREVMLCRAERLDNAKDPLRGRFVTEEGGRRFYPHSE